MKRILLSLTILALVISCGPSETVENDLSRIVGEWKNTSDEATALNEEIGTKLMLVRRVVGPEEPSANINITVEGQDTTCEAELERMHNAMEIFLRDWQTSSEVLNDLTNRMQMARWTGEDTKQLEDLELELRKKEADLAQYRKELEDISSKCQLENTPYVLDTNS